MTDTMTETEWMQERVRIHCNPALTDEWRECDAWVHADAPGLAVTSRQEIDGPHPSKYVITHLRTGFRIGHGCPLDEAKERALMLGQLSGWDCDQEGIKAKPVAWRKAARMLAYGEMRNEF